MKQAKEWLNELSKLPDLHENKVIPLIKDIQKDVVLHVIQELNDISPRRAVTAINFIRHVIYEKI